MKVAASRSHEVPSRAPLHVRRGESVIAETRDSEWPAFVFVRAESGEGWVPSRYLSARSGEVTVLEAYDTTELPVAAGDELEIVVRDDESGWHWCRAGDGREGWVPVRCLEGDPRS